MTRGQLREENKALRTALRSSVRENMQLKQALAESTLAAGDVISFLKHGTRNPLRLFTGWLIKLQMRKDPSFLGNPDTQRLHS